MWWTLIVPIRQLKSCKVIRRKNVAIVQHEFVGYASQWNWAINSLPIDTAWTMKLDADERVTPELKEELYAELPRAAADLSGFYIRFFLVFLGRSLRWGGLGSNYLLRVWRTNEASFENREVNEHLQTEGETKHLKGYIEHKDSKSFADWLDRHNRYSSMEAKLIVEKDVTGEVQPRLLGGPEQRRMWFKSAYHMIPSRIFAAFGYFCFRYFIKLGFLDGVAGFQYWFMHASYLYWTDLKVCEYRRTKKCPQSDLAFTWET